MQTASGEGPPQQPDPPRPTGGVPVARGADPNVPLAPDVEAVGSRDERFGPLAVRRYVKADGRTLILYERDSPQAPA